MARLVRDARVVDLSPSAVAIDIKRGGLIVERGLRAFRLNEPEKRALYTLLAERYRKPEETE